MGVGGRGSRAKEEEKEAERKEPPKKSSQGKREKRHEAVPEVITGVSWQWMEPKGRFVTTGKAKTRQGDRERTHARGNHQVPHEWKKWMGGGIVLGTDRI
jgi:hypothetical protein